MSQDGIKQVIGRAVVDAEFKNLLFSNSAEALKGFDLTAEEAAGLSKMPHAEFDKLLSDVETRVSKAGIHLGNFHPGRNNGSGGSNIPGPINITGPGP